MPGLKDEEINSLIAIHVLKTHTPSQIKAVKRLVESSDPDVANEIWADHGVYNYAADPNDALMLLYNIPGLESWSVLCDLVNKNLFGEMRFRGKTYKVRADTPPRAVCLVALAAMGVIKQSVAEQSELSYDFVEPILTEERA